MNYTFEIPRTGTLVLRDCHGKELTRIEVKAGEYVYVHFHMENNSKVPIKVTFNDGPVKIKDEANDD